MHIQESAEMYLETILILSGTKSLVRSIDVGEYMGFSKPSVSRAVSRLKQGGYITVEPDGRLLLTEEGRAVAEKTYEKHKTLSRFFILLGVSEEVAMADACRVEHYLSDETFSAIKKHLNNSDALK